MKILLSGFNAFGDLAVNSSQVIVQEIEKRWQHSSSIHLATQILPTEYGAAEDQIRNLIREIKPDVVLCLGVADKGSAISLERIALNWDDDAYPDNAGDVRTGRQIADGPAAYWSTLPLEDMRTTLERQGIPVNFSNHAGTYVCNHIFYSALHEVRQLNLTAICGFIHLPSIAEKAGWIRRSSGLPLEMMVSAIESCLKVIVDHAPAVHSSQIIHP